MNREIILFILGSAILVGCLCSVSFAQDISSSAATPTTQAPQVSTQDKNVTLTPNATLSPTKKVTSNVTKIVVTTKNKTTVTPKATKNKTTPTPKTTKVTLKNGTVNQSKDNTTGYFLVTSNIEGASVSFITADGKETPAGTIVGGKLSFPVDLSNQVYKRFSVKATGFNPFSADIPQYPIARGVVTLVAQLQAEDTNLIADTGLGGISVSGDTQGGTIILDRTKIAHNDGTCCGGG